MVGLHLVVLIFQTEALEHILKISGYSAAMEINIDSSRQQHRPQKSEWTLAGTQSTAIVRPRKWIFLLSRNSTLSR